MIRLICSVSFLSIAAMHYAPSFLGEASWVQAAILPATLIVGLVNRAGLDGESQHRAVRWLHIAADEKGEAVRKPSGADCRIELQGLAEVLRRSRWRPEQRQQHYRDNRLWVCWRHAAQNQASRFHGFPPELRHGRSGRLRPFSGA